MDYDSYTQGRQGQSIANAKDVDAWAVGDMQRQLDGSATPLRGGEHPHAFQLFILWAVTGFPIGLLSYWQWFPWTKEGWLPWGHVASFVCWAILNLIIYKVLCGIPRWLSGAIMGTLLGSLAAWITWAEVDTSLSWVGGVGVGVGAIGFLLFAALK